MGQYDERTDGIKAYDFVSHILKVIIFNEETYTDGRIVHTSNDEGQKRKPEFRNIPSGIIPSLGL